MLCLQAIMSSKCRQKVKLNNLLISERDSYASLDLPWLTAIYHTFQSVLLVFVVENKDTLEFPTVLNTVLKAKIAV